jgi:hypothetical protein
MAKKRSPIKLTPEGTVFGILLSLATYFCIMEVLQEFSI